MKKRGTTLAFGIVAGLGFSAATSAPVSAQTAPAAPAQPTVLMPTATYLAHRVANGPANKPVGKNTGAGVMDADPAFLPLPNGNVRIAVLGTVSSAQPNNAGSYMQGGIYIGDLTADKGLVTSPATSMKMFPTLNGERAFMRPQLKLFNMSSKVYGIALIATEDNGRNNGNPQTSAFVVDETGATVTIENSTRQNKKDKPTNIITLGDMQDDQQWGPHSACDLGPTPTGGAKFLIGMQRNNNDAFAAQVVVEPGAAGGVNVTVPYIKELVQDATHNRAKVTCPAPGSTSAYLVSVDGNNQPSDAIRMVEFNANTGEQIQSKLIAEKSKVNNKTIHTVQPSGAVLLGNGLAAVGYQESEKAGKNNGGNGHTGGANQSIMAIIKLSDLSVVNKIRTVAPYQRHAFSFATTFGPGAGQPAIGVMGGSSTGTGDGKLQIVSVDGVGKPTVDPAMLFQVSKFADVANLPARGKRNPNNQGAGFLNGIGGVPNPGYGKGAAGFMPEVKTFFLSALPGYAELPAANRESLWVSLVPATWDPKVTPVPGPATENVQPGPLPVVNAPAPQVQGGVDAFGNPVPGGPGGTVTGDYGGADLSSGGCSSSPRKASSAIGATLLGLGLVAGLRRRRSSSKRAQ